MKPNPTDKLIEIYRNMPQRNYQRQSASGGSYGRGIPTRTTKSGNRVDWDEPSIETENQISDRIQRLQRQKQNLQQTRLGRERLKKKNMVPQKQGKPMFEGVLNEDLNKALYLIRQYYYSPKTMRFREWCDIMEKVFDELE